MDSDLLALRIKVLGGKAGAAEVKAVNSEVAKTGPLSKQASTMATRSSAATSAAFKKQAAMMQATGRTMTYGLTLPLTAVGVMAVKTAANFTKSMAQVGVATGAGGRHLQTLKDYALEMGAKTIFSANEAAEAMLNLAKAGLTPAQITGGALKSTMSLAAAGSMELAEAGNLVGASMKTFRLEAKDSGRIADALAGGANKSAADVRELATSLSQAGQSAAMNKLTLNETVGTLAAMADQGLRGSDAGTSLKTFLMRLNPVTKKAKEEMARLGLDFYDANGEFVGMAETSRKLTEALGDMTDKERNAAIQVLFGSDAQRAANIVYRAGPSVIDNYTKATEEKGAAERMANAQMKGLPGALEKLSGSLETAALVLGEAMAPAIVTVAGGIEGLANAFTGLPPEVQTTVAAVGALAALAGPVLWFAGSMAKAVIAIRELRAAEAAGGGGMLAGGKGRFLKGLGIAGAGLGISQLVGQATGAGGPGIGVGDWLKNVGSGAAVGAGIGSVVPVIGTGVGAAVGGTLGGVKTAVDKLTSSEKQLTYQQQRLVDSAKSVQEWWGKQRAASRGLVAADDRVRGAQRRSKRATDEMRRARGHLNAVVSEYGAKSRPAIHAEAVLTGKIGAHRRALKRLENAERLRGVALSAYKTQTNITVLAERHRINVLTQLRDKQARLFQAAKDANPQSERTRNLANQLLGTEGKLAQATKKHGETLSEAASKGGQKYAKFLANANEETIRAGGLFKMLNERAKGLEQTMQRLSEQEFKIPTPGAGTPRRPHGRNAAGTNFWRGGTTWLAERGPELVNLPRGARVTPAPATRRLLAAVGDPQRAAAVDGFARRGGGDTRYLVAQPIKIGRKVVAEAVTEATEDAEARL